jgi:hypothetical protein
MQFYPHNISLTNVAQAVSASMALSGSFINNFAAIPVTTVATASVALNITGSRGVDGTGIIVVGPSGSQGPNGARGFSGKSIFLLSSSWHNFGTQPCATPPVQCDPINFGSVSVNGTDYICDFGSLITYYVSTPFTGAGNVLYTNDICTRKAVNFTPAGAYDQVVYNTDANGSTIFSATCLAI